jgi:hypothetical protein
MLPHVPLQRLLFALHLNSSKCGSGVHFYLGPEYATTSTNAQLVMAIGGISDACLVSICWQPRTKLFRLSSSNIFSASHAEA